MAQTPLEGQEACLYRISLSPSAWEMGMWARTPDCRAHRAWRATPAFADLPSALGTPSLSTTSFPRLARRLAFASFLLLFMKCFYLLTLEGLREEERTVYVLFHSSLFDACMCPALGLNPPPWPIGRRPAFVSNCPPAELVGSSAPAWGSHRGGDCAPGPQASPAGPAQRAGQSQPEGLVGLPWASFYFFWP